MNKMVSIDSKIKARYEEVNGLPMAINNFIASMDNMVQNFSKEVNNITSESKEFIGEVIKWDSNKK